MRSFLLRLGLALGMPVCISLLAIGAASGAELIRDDPWLEIDDTGSIPPGKRLILPVRYRALQLDLAAMRHQLDRAPLEGTAAPLKMAWLRS